MTLPVSKANHSITVKTAIGAGWLITGRIFARLVGLCSTFILARILVPADFGLLAMALTFSQAVDGLTQVGIQDALVRSEHRDRDLYNTAFSLQIVRNLLAGLVIAAGAYPASIYFKEPRLFPLILILALLSSLYLENVGIVEFRREMRFSNQFVILAIPKIIQFCTTVLFAFTCRSYWALVAGLIASQTSYVILTYVMHPFRPAITFSRWRELVGFSFWTWLSSLARIVQQRVDPFLIGPRAGSAALGSYLVATEIGLLPVTELIAPIAAALFPGMAMAQREGRDSVNMAVQTMVSMLPVLMGLAISLSAASGYIVAVLLGEKWGNVQPLMAAITWGCLFLPLSRICSATLVARGEVRRDFFVVAVSSALRVGCIGFAVFFWGELTMIAWASVVYAFGEGVCSLIALRSLKKGVFKGTAAPVFRVMLAGALAVAAIWFSGYGWQSVAGMPVFWALFYGGCVVVASLGLFAALLLLIWLASGRPEGPEGRILGLGLTAGRHVFARLRRA